MKVDEEKRGESGVMQRKRYVEKVRMKREREEPDQ